jgi:GntR family transcriptional regulator/MocR family aminotransferase
MPDMNRMVGLTGATRVYLPLDESGLVLDAAFDSCHAVFSTASHQCPTAASMPVERRRRLLERARANDIVIVEDTFETESLAQGEEPSSLKSLDIDGRVIYIGSLSKHLAPGLRVGVVVAPRPVISKLRALRRLIHRHPPGNTQRALAMFIERGYYRSHVRRVARELDQRCAVFEEAMRQSLPDFRWQHRAGTASFWVHMPPQVDGARVQEEARREGLQLESGENFFHAGPVQRNTLRIGLSSTSEQSIREGITILQRVVQRLQPVARAKAKAKA